MTQKSKILTQQEEDIIARLNKIRDEIVSMGGGLQGNHVELTQVFHVIQGFVVQPALHRLDPATFGNWYGDKL